MAQTHPAGAEIATLFTAAQPLFVSVHVSSTFALEVLVMVGLTTIRNSPRAVGADVASGVVIVGDPTVLPVPVAEPLKVNGSVAGVLLLT